MMMEGVMKEEESGARRSFRTRMRRVEVVVRKMEGVRMMMEKGQQVRRKLMTIEGMRKMEG